MSLTLRNFTVVTGSGLSLSLLLALGCSSTVPGTPRPRPVVATTGAGGGLNGTGGGGMTPGSGGDANSAGGTGGTGGTTVVIPQVDALTPSNLVCTPGASAPPAARRIIRLAPSELVASVKGAGPVDVASTTGFDTSVLGESPKPYEVVEKGFHTKADAVATGTAALVSASPAGLSCSVAEFGGANAACTTSYLEAMARKFFRGRVEAGDVPKLKALSDAVATRSDGRTALEYAIRAMSLSPKSLYFTEGMDRTASNTTAAVMGPAEMASFASYRITKQPPSEQLLQALAAAPNLDTAGLNTLLDQQFMPDQLVRGTTDFLASWLNVAALTTNVNKDTTKHPIATKAFLGQLQQETYDTFYSQFASGNGDLLQLLTKNVESTLLSDATNPVYQTYKRPGVMAMPGFIASISAPEHTGLPKRGKFLVNAFYCEGQMPPPPGILRPPQPPMESERQLFERLEALPGCQGCHTRINPLAYPMERYDEIGNPRALDDKMNVIDTSGAHAIVPGTPRDFLYSDMLDLGTKMATQPYVQTCAGIQVLKYVARRAPASPAQSNNGRDDSCTVQQISQVASANSFKLTDLFRDSLVKTMLLPRADRP